MAAAVQRSSPIDIVAGDSGDEMLVESSNLENSPFSDSSPSRTASTSSLHESVSSGSLNAHSSASSSPSSDVRKHLSTAKPGRSCLLPRDRPSRRKTVSFAFDSPSPSSDDLMTDYNLDLAFGTQLPTNQLELEANSEAELNPHISSKAPLDRALKHMEALSLKRYHANMGLIPYDDATHGDIDLLKSRSPSPPPIASTNALASLNSLPLDRPTQLSPLSPTEPHPTGISLTSPLSGLKLIGSEIDHSNTVLQSFLKNAASPCDSESSTNWVWSTSLVVTAPVVFSLVMDTLLG